MKTAKLRLITGLILVIWAITSVTGTAGWQPPTLWAEPVRAFQGEPLTVQVNTPVNGYGNNTLVWEPQVTFGSPPASDTLYSVTVNNIIIGGQPRTFTYNVIVFDPAY